MQSVCFCNSTNFSNKEGFRECNPESPNKINGLTSIKKMKKIQNTKSNKSISNYEKYEKGSTRVLIPPEPRELLEKLRKMSGVSYQTLTDIAIQQLYERAVAEGKISFTVIREVKIDIKKQ